MKYEIKMKTADGRFVDAVLRFDGRPATFDYDAANKVLKILQSEDSNEYSIQLVQ
jgi:hypothetical protein